MYEMNAYSQEQQHRYERNQSIPGYPPNTTEPYQLDYGQYTQPADQQMFAGNYSQPTYNPQQLFQQPQQFYGGPVDPNGGLASYSGGGGYHPNDYPDVNSLEPTLMMGNGQPVPDYYAYPPQQQLPQMAFIPQQFNGSPTGSSHTSDESDEFYNWHPYKRSPPSLEVDCRAKPRGKPGKKRKPKRDPNEPQKPVSAYALFFRDTQAAIKGQNPNASFGEVSKIVASMWDGLDADAKNAYKQKTETAKKDYLKQLAAYRANLIGKNGGGNSMMEALTQQDFAQHHKFFSQQGRPSPDSTTLAQDQDQPQQPEPASAAHLLAIGEKSLASLIAEPAPQLVLTATTTLTVPQAYIPARTKAELEENCQFDADSKMALNPGKEPWDREFCPNQGLVQHCRDVFHIWGQRGQQQATAANYAPV